MPSCRTAVLWAAFLFSLCGWGGVLWSWLDHGEAATLTAGFYVALAVGATATISAAVTFVMPEQARIFADGFREGMACSTCPLRESDVDGVPAPVLERRHLSTVR